MSERERSLSEKVAASESPRMQGTVFVAEDLQILLQLRAAKRHVSVSKTIEELLSPQIENLRSASLLERTSLLLQSKARIRQKYEDYERMYYPKSEDERLRGPHPFMGVNWVLPRALVGAIVEWAQSEDIAPEDFMSDMLSEAMPRNN